MEKKVYLLRLQRSQGNVFWRVTLQNVHTGELLRFANEREMFRYLLKALSVRLVGPEESAASELGQGDDAS